MCSSVPMEQALRDLVDRLNERAQPQLYRTELRPHRLVTLGAVGSRLYRSRMARIRAVRISKNVAGRTGIFFPLLAMCPPSRFVRAAGERRCEIRCLPSALASVKIHELEK